MNTREVDSAIHKRKISGTLTSYSENIKKIALTYFMNFHMYERHKISHITTVAYVM